MADPPTNLTNSPDYFKLLDDIDTNNSVNSVNNVNNNNINHNILNSSGDFLFGNYDFNGTNVVIGSYNNGTIGGSDYINGMRSSPSSASASSSSLSSASTSSFSSLPSTISNQSLEYQFDYGTHSNDSVKQNYEAGSNFMLLLEDFGEYFYNYNGSNGIGGISGNGSNGITAFDSQTNCSIANSTCVDITGEWLHGN